MKCLRVYVGNGCRCDSGVQGNEWKVVGIMLWGRISRTGGRRVDTLGRWWVWSRSRSMFGFLGTGDKTGTFALLGVWKKERWESGELPHVILPELSGLRNEGRLVFETTSTPDFSYFRYFALRFLNHTYKKATRFVRGLQITARMPMYSLIGFLFYNEC